MMRTKFVLPRPQLIALLLAVVCLLPAVIPPYYPVGSQLTLRSKVDHSRYSFPFGGRVLFPHYRLVALYGTPDTPVLGALGEQPLDASIARAKALAAAYQPLVRERVMPTLEIISTVASSYPLDDNSYSYAIDKQVLLQWITAARRQSVYIVLDLQPGRTDFLTQAEELEPLLDEPNVGLALDPEWRLGPTQIPLVQIGSVSIDEVNRTASWLATLTRRRHLPQKLFLLHQFRLDMLPGREHLDTGHHELAYAIQMDGQGTQPQKLDTWATIVDGQPANVRFGWKNFYQKDAPMRSPAETMQLTPQPWYVSYQ